MRQTKFRAWDKQTGIWHGVSSIDWYLKGNPGICGVTVVLESGHTQYLDRSNIELVEFTGLKDKNGKEIYEGDIVRFLNGNYPMDAEKIRNVGAIVYNSGSAEYEVDRTLDLGDAGGHNLSFFVGFCELEVIGNIFETPALLK